jgi:hypothetical protein
MALTQVQVGLGGNSNAPAFSVYNNSAQTLASVTDTLIQFPTKEFDTTGSYNNTGSTATLNGLSVPAYAFCPNVAGYYQVSANLRVGSSATSIRPEIWKNGTKYKDFTEPNVASASSASCIVYLNGTGDYVQFYTLIGSGQATSGGSADCWFQGCLIRGS